MKELWTVGYGKAKVQEQGLMLELVLFKLVHSL